ncbi:hypothetical protein ACN082_00525 [Rothia sp. CCM 9417]|uniref:hypothetical protein n=1 Tax=Rothia sp. CCM 9417 TaxID=3402657 RepID=UPI003ADD5D33
MGNTPRKLNRFFLAVLGLVLLVLGLVSLCLPLVPQARDLWAEYVQPLEEPARTAFDRVAFNTVDGQTSLLTLLFVLLLLLVVIALIMGIIAQKPKKSKTLLSQQDTQTAGRTTISDKFIKQAITDGFESHPDILSVSVSSQELKRSSACSVKLEVRQGADIASLEKRAAQVVAGLDQLLGHKIPLLVRVTGGLRSTFADETQRVR